MANAEWLTQLLSGLGGAFTGEVAARGRLAQEEETQRKMQELQAEKERQRRILELRGGPMSEATQRELLQLGEAPSNINALRDMFMPTSPRYSSRNVGPRGEVYYTEPTSGKSIRATDPMGNPLSERVPSIGGDESTNRPLTRAQIGAGLAWLNSQLNSTTSKEQADLFQKTYGALRTQYRNAPPGEIGYYMMQGMRAKRTGTQNNPPSIDDLDF